MNDAAFQDDHAGAARRSCTVVGRVTLLEAIVRGEVGLVRGEDKTVWGLLAPQRQGSEEALIVTLSQLCSPFLAPCAGFSGCLPLCAIS